MTNLTTTQIGQKNPNQTRVNLDELARREAAKSFANLIFLDNAELALVGGGGAHGGNAL